jgi:hypothetical protein
MQARKTATLNLRIAPELKAAAEKAAADDNRSLTSLFETLLLSHLREHGYLLKGAGGSSPGGARKPRSTGKRAGRAR